MALSKKYERNLQNVQSMLDGTYGRKKIQISTTNKKVERKDGDVWYDLSGNRWEKRNGNLYKGNWKEGEKHHSWDEECIDCGKNPMKNIDRDFYLKWKRCYYCQIDFIAKLKSIPVKFWAWQRLHALRAMDDVENIMIQIIEEKEKESKNKIFDKTVANALANSNVSMTMKKNIN